MGSREQYQDKLLIIGCGFLPDMNDMQGLAASGKVPWSASSVIPFSIKIIPSKGCCSKIPISTIKRGLKT